LRRDPGAQRRNAVSVAGSPCRSGRRLATREVALRHGLRVCEVPVSYRKRVGVSKITGTVSGTIRAGYKILYTIFRHSLSRKA